jgi:hypothetical protein
MSNWDALESGANGQRGTTVRFYAMIVRALCAPFGAFAQNGDRNIANAPSNVPGPEERLLI